LKSEGKALDRTTDGAQSSRMKAPQQFPGVLLTACFYVIKLHGVESVQDPPLRNLEDFRQWMTELSNWGRWGKEDQLGALNLITPEKRKEALAIF